MSSPLNLPTPLLQIKMRDNGGFFFRRYNSGDVVMVAEVIGGGVEVVGESDRAVGVRCR